LFFWVTPEHRPRNLPGFRSPHLRAKGAQKPPRVRRFWAFEKVGAMGFLGSDTRSPPPPLARPREMTPVERSGCPGGGGGEHGNPPPPFVYLGVGVYIEGRLAPVPRAGRGGGGGGPKWGGAVVFCFFPCPSRGGFVCPPPASPHPLPPPPPGRVYPPGPHFGRWYNLLQSPPRPPPVAVVSPQTTRVFRSFRKAAGAAENVGDEKPENRRPVFPEVPPRVVVAGGGPGPVAPRALFSEPRTPSRPGLLFARKNRLWCPRPNDCAPPSPPPPLGQPKPPLGGSPRRPPPPIPPSAEVARIGFIPPPAAPNGEKPIPPPGPPFWGGTSRTGPPRPLVEPPGPTRGCRTSA